MDSRTAQTAPQVAQPVVKQERLYFLDWLRVVAFALLVFYPVGMY